MITSDSDMCVFLDDDLQPTMGAKKINGVWWPGMWAGSVVLARYYEHYGPDAFRHQHVLDHVRATGGFDSCIMWSWRRERTA